jgi:hypothetical protein
VPNYICGSKGRPGEECADPEACQMPNRDDDARGYDTVVANAEAVTATAPHVALTVDERSARVFALTGVSAHVSLEEACLALGLNYKTVVCWPSSRDPRRLAKWSALKAWKTLSRQWRVPISAVVAIQAKATTGLGMARKARRAG